MSWCERIRQIHGFGGGEGGGGDLKKLRPNLRCGDKLYRGPAVYHVVQGNSNYWACVDELLRCIHALSVSL